MSRPVLAALLAACVCAASGSADPAAGAGPDYREPSAAVTSLLTATPPPEPMLHAGSRRVALLYREPVIALERLARPRLGLAGFRFDPSSRSSGVEPLVTRVELVAVDAPGSAPLEWRPAGGALLDHVHFSPDGRTLSALAQGDGPARLVLFDVERGRERVLPTPVNPAWGDPCRWIGNDALLCRVVPEKQGALPAAYPAPTVVEHEGAASPTRTYPYLLENAYEDALFEHYFDVEVARVDLAGRARRVPGLRGLLESVDPSPDGALAVVARIERPFSRLLPARQFENTVEVWDLARGERRYSSKRPPSSDEPEQDPGARERPRRFTWRPGTPVTIGWVERGAGSAPGPERWMALEQPFTGTPVGVAASSRPIRSFDWTSAGTPYFATATEDGLGVRVFAVREGRTEQLGEWNTADRYGSPGRALRVNGDGPVLELDGRIFLAGDGLGPGGAQPFLDAFELRTHETTRLFSAEPGVFERVVGLLDPAQPVIVTSRETEREPPALYLVQAGARTLLRRPSDPYPQLARASRKLLEYRRNDGVGLSGTLYLPEGRREGERLPTLVWIYPYEFSDREHAEQLDVRGFRFHQVKGPSPLAAVVAGYAVLLNPTVPIVYEADATNDDYLPQLVASADAAVDHLVALGVTDPTRVAVAGRSYGAFSAANLLIHSKRFATAIAMSGAYNRTLTPFGFQHEKRSFWQATELYTQISPFFFADRVHEPLLLVHGGADENAGTPPLQARRFFHALAGEGATVRYVELPGEGHHYWARENVLLASAEMLDWLARTIGGRR